MANDLPVGRVGKTSLLIKYVQNEFSETQETVNASFLEKRLDLDGERIILKIWVPFR